MAYKIAYERFNSIDSLLSRNDTRKVNSAFKGRDDLASDNGGDDFTGTKSYQEAVDLIRGGWDKPLQELKDAVKKAGINTNTQADRRRPTTAVVGYSPCVPNAIMGLPNSMVSTEITKQKVKAVTVVYSPTVNCGWSTSEITKSGITMLKIVDLLERQGVRVRLTVEGMSATEDNDLSIVWVDVKDWKEHIDLKKIAFPVAHPSMLRRIAFKWLETCPQITNGGYRYGYGTPIGNDSYESVVKKLKDGGLLQENEYYINAQICKKLKHDVDAVMEKAGMSALKKQIQGKGA